MEPEGFPWRGLKNGSCWLPGKILCAPEVDLIPFLFPLCPTFVGCEHSTAVKSAGAEMRPENAAAPSGAAGLGIGDFEVRESIGNNTNRFYRIIYPPY
jgi:hypothetical protein